LKGLNNWLEGRVKELEDELLKVKTDIHNHEMTYKASILASQLTMKIVLFCKRKLTI